MFEMNKQYRITCACESPYAKSVKNLTHEGQATDHTGVFFQRDKIYKK